MGWIQMTEREDLHAFKLESLNTSIVHWAMLIAYIADKNMQSVIDEGWSGASCQCCIDFYDGQDFDNSCRDCPVAEVTGALDCYRTPWSTANSELMMWAGTDPKYDKPGTIEKLRLKALKAAGKELDFLNAVYKKLEGDTNVTKILQ